MRRRRFVVGLGGVAGGGSLLVGSEAFSAAEVDREATVGVADDDDAVVAITCDGSSCDTDDGEFSNRIAHTSVEHDTDDLITSIHEASFRVGNQFPGASDIEVTVEADDPGEVVITYHTDDGSWPTIGKGNSAEFTPQITADVPCSVHEFVEIRLKIRRPGEDDPFGTITREVEVDVEVEYEEVQNESDSANW